MTKPSSPLIVGVGASAGGLEAFQQLLVGLGDQPGLAIVLVQHLDANTKSLLAELLVKTTSMEVVEISGRKKLRVNTVYVCPPHTLLELKNGYIQISKPAVHQRHPLAIDHFFHSIADDQTERGIGVILSGAGSDGTLGLKAISDRGGLTFAQEPESATHESMPRSAATIGVADQVLVPADIAAELVRYAKHLADVGDKDSLKKLRHDIAESIPAITDALVKVTEHNFQHYKITTLCRRIQRRMHVLQMRNASDYVAYLEVHEDESKTLFRELLIGVTHFFRDPEAFSSLAETVLSKIFADRTSEDCVRIWVAGCANGAEAFTLAILCRETMQRLNVSPEVQIFATDIDERALQVARAGIYPVGIEEHVSAARLKRFFVKRGKQYHVTKEIRELVLFSTHNLISDSPFSRQDLICCRNLLIYLGSHLQNKLIPLFHYALRPSGFLFLGPSETIASHGELFRPHDVRHRISQRKGTVLGTQQNPNQRTSRVPSIHVRDQQPDVATNLTTMRQRILLDEFSPKSCVIDSTGQVLNAAPSMNKYLSMGDGDFQNNIIKMSAKGLRIGLRTAIAEATRTCRKIQHENMSIRDGDKTQEVMITVQPMPQLGEDEPLFMVVFQDVRLPIDRVATATAIPDSNDADSIISQMELELQTARDDLECMMQDMDATNEELKSSNEELRSMNEELQSANEELATSKDEIRASSDEVSRAHEAMENLLRSTQIATVFLDANGHVQWFSPTVDDIYNVIPTDVGRPLSHITHNTVEMPPIPSIDKWRQLPDGDSTFDSKSGTYTNSFIEHEVQLDDGRWFLRRVLPFLRDEHADGLILTFIDVTDQKRAAIRLETEHRITKILADADSFTNVVNDVLDVIRTTLNAEFCALWLVDQFNATLRCIQYSIAPNDAVLESFAREKSSIAFSRGEGLPGRVWDSLQPKWIVELAKDARFIRKQVVAAGMTSGMAMPIVMGSTFYGVIELFTKVRLEEDQSTLNMLQSIGTEIGQFINRRDMDERLRDHEARKSAILAASLDAIITMDLDGAIVDFNPAAERTFGFTHQEVVGRPLAETIVPPAFREAHVKGLSHYLETGESKVIGRRIELTALHANGTTFPIELAINAATTRSGSPFFTAHLRDITAQKQFVETIQQRDDQIVALLNSTAEGIYGIDSDGNCTFANASCARLLGYENAESLIGKQMHQLIHHSHADGKEYENHRCQIYESYRSGTRIHADNEVFWRSDGTCFDVEYWSYPLARENKTVGCVVTFLNITDRKRRELDLADREAHLRRVINNQLGLVGVIGRDGNLLDVDDRSMKISGLTRDDCVGKHFAECGWWTYDDSVAQQMREAMKRAFAGEKVRYDVGLYSKEGEPLMIDFMIAPVFDADGNVEFLIPSGVDISERKAAEVALKQRVRLSELHTTLALELTRSDTLNTILQACCERFVDALDVAFSRVWLYDQRDSMLKLAASAGLYTHLDGDHSNIPLGNFKIGRIAQQQRALLTNDVAHDPNVSDPDWAVREGMTAFAGYPLIVSGRTVGVMAMFSQHEFSAVEFEQLQPMSVAIAQCIDRRNTELALEAARDLAQAANASKSEFLANMSHEIRTPMTAILGYSDLLRDLVDNAEARQHLRTIRRNGNYLLDIINDILDLSKIEAGKLDVECERFPPSRLIEDVRSIMEVRAADGGLSLQVEYDGELPRVIESDAKRLKQILINLVGNAIKFTREGRVKIRVRYEDRIRNRQRLDQPQTNRKSGKSGYLLFDIVDTGIGMSDEQQERLFKPFSQGDASVTRNFGGTGLGLAISKRLAEMLGGEITASSTQGVGSTFTVTISTGDLSGVELINYAEGLESSHARQGLDGRDGSANDAVAKEPIRLDCHVLIVDDRRDIRFLSKRLLTKAGATAEECADGQLAVDHMKNCLGNGICPDLILLDMQMPNLDGYETARQLRNLGYKGPIIALTADAMQGDMNECLEAGCNDYLSKPIDADKMLQLVAEMTGRR